MTMRLIVIFNDDKYANLEVEEFHEDGEFIKAYSCHNELVGIFKTTEIKVAYVSERRNDEPV